ncbi:MAG: histidine phosphatase family protein [Deltaproteobacteria bacterium]|nr:histidine phosphatase family protein [Deltaproteobacteria bacterium]MBW2362014.1 histidine phosphatase family protein [Deltaproteobacteria bacterium]
MIHLIRHGETAGNAQRVIQFPDTPLSERGHEQARSLAARFRDEPVAAVLCSDYARAEATARCLAAATGATLAVEPLLRERSFGDLRGTPYAELDVDPFALDYAPPGGESWPVFHARVDAAWRRIQEVAAAEAGPLAVVTHGLVCLSLSLRYLALPEAHEIETSGFANTSVTTLEARAPFRVTRLDCTRHLDCGAGDGAPV